MHVASGLACRFSLVAILFITLFVQQATNTQAQGPPLDVDLAALTLTPADIDQPGFFHAGAYVQPLDEWAANLATYRGEDPATVRHHLQNAGWERKYVSILRQPAAGAPGSFAQAVITSISTFDDTAGAVDAFTFTEDESAVATAVDVSGSRTVGDHSEITRDAGVSGVSGQSFVSLDLAFQIAKFHAGVTLYQYEVASTSPASPITKPAATPVTASDIATVERLAAMLVDRLTNPGDTPGLGLVTLRLAGDERTYTTYDDAYYRLRGVDVPILAESDEAAAGRITSYGAAINVYQLWQGIDTDEGGLLYAATLFELPSESDAVSWLDDALALLARNPSYRRLEPVATNTVIGDQSQTLTFTPRGASTTVSGTMVIARVASVVVRLQLAPGGNQVIDLQPSVTALAVQQVDCLRRGNCAPLSLPDV